MPEFLTQPGWGSAGTLILLGVILLIWGLLSNRNPWPWILLVAIPILLELTTPLKPFTWWLARPLTWIAENPWRAAGIVALYLILGVVVAVVRWTKLVYDAREAVDDTLREQLPRVISNVGKGGRHVAGVSGTSQWAPYTPEEQEKEILREKDALKRSAVLRVTGRSDYPPKIADFKARFFGWASAWPFVGAWMVIDDPVRRFYNWCYRRLSGMLQGVSDRAFADLEQ